jgi:hypothetical protein
MDKLNNYPREYFDQPWAMPYVCSKRTAKADQIENTLDIEQVQALWMDAPVQKEPKLCRINEAGPFTLENCYFHDGEPWHDQVHYCKKCNDVTTHKTKTYKVLRCKICDNRTQPRDIEDTFKKDFDDLKVVS